MSQLKKIVSPELYEQIRDLFGKITKEHEYEFMFYNFNNVLMGYDKFIMIMKYLKQRFKTNIVFNDTLDVVYNEPETNKLYRITITGIPNINKYMKMVHNKKNHVIFGVLASLILEGDTNLKILLKTKDSEDVVDIDGLNIRARLSKETDVSKDDLEKLTKLNRDNILNISFRLKNRLTAYVNGSEGDAKFIKVDVTTTKNSKNINKTEFIIPRYELELECGAPKPDDKLFDVFLNETEILLKILQQSNYIITRETSTMVLDNYAKILSLDVDKMSSIDARQSFSLEVQHVTEVLPNRYAVTDKADGDRYILIIVDNHVYLISTNLTVRDTGIDIDNEQYNGSILDGELIFLHGKNRHLYMVFDCLFKGETDVRKVNKFMDRLRNADEVIQQCFVFGKQKYYQIQYYEFSGDTFDLRDVINFHDEQINAYMTDINKNIEIEKHVPLIRRKYFMESFGAKPWEIFAYSTVMYDKYTHNTKCPYLLDGLIYHPLDQAYITNVRESKFVEYKWKPPSKNSVDFFIQFEKDKETGKVLTIYDNSVDEYVKNRPYKICHLYVGQKSKIGEQPVLFRPDEELYIAYIFLNNGEVRDLNGNVIVDKTVVEFYYNNDPNIDMRFRWVPIRTRYDKTESVLRYRRRYGNYIDVANKVWRSIINPILMTDMDELAVGGEKYERKIASLRAKIGHELIISAAKEDIYYQIKTNLAKPMRQFHNWIKSIIIYTYCHPMYQNERQLSILDISCGRGGDIMKFYYSKCAFYVGTDVDKEGLISATDGAQSRYAQLRKSHPNFPEMNFIQADSSALFNYDDQNKALGGMDEANKRLIERFFPNDPNKRVMFDRVNCQFAMHYLLKNNETWNNFKQNINMTLKPGGYFMITVFDADRVRDLFKDGEEKYTVYYTTNRGEKKILFEITKRYDENGSQKLGNAIDLYAAWMFREGQTRTEYLVEPDFVIGDLFKDCGLTLVDTDLFSNQYEIHKTYFKSYATYDENLETRKFLLNVAKFYEFNEVNGGLFKFSRLNRYYVFRKLEKQKAQKGGLDPDSIVHDLDLKEAKNHTYVACIFHVLKTHKLIPKKLTLESFMKDFNVNVLDQDLSDLGMANVNRKISFSHIIDDKESHVLNGIATVVLEKDCNGYYDADVFNKNCDKYLVFVKEGGVYRPLYRTHGRAKNGIFSYDDIKKNFDL